jgi:hypothetical protein
MFIKVLTTFIITVSSFNLQARDYSTTHTFNSGDVISADMMNEIFSKIEDVSKVVTSSDFLGTWDLVQTTCKNGGPGNCSSLVMNGMTDDSNGITRSRSDEVVFGDDGDGTYSYTQTNYASLVTSGAGNSSGSGGFAIVNGMALFDNSTLGMGMLNIRQISPTRMVLHIFNSGSASYNIVRLDKKQIPPSNPTDFSITTSELTNILTWTDNSDDEASFKVYNKTSPTGLWSLIDTGAGLTVLSNVTSFAVKVSAAGDYWYRVKASNAYGNSVGTKVVKVTNSN